MRHLFILSIGCLAAVTSALAQPNPTAQQVAQARTANFCADPWLTIAIQDVVKNSRYPNGFGYLGECNNQLYNGGRWQTYAQLRQAVSDTMASLAAQGVAIKMWVTPSGANSPINLLVISVTSGQIGYTTRFRGDLIALKGGGYTVSSPGGMGYNDGAMWIGQDTANYTPAPTRVKVKLPGGRAIILGR